MPISEATAKHKAAQLAGSCRLARMKVSSTEEGMMFRIINGKLDADQLRSGLQKKYKRQTYL